MHYGERSVKNNNDEGRDMKTVKIKIKHGNTEVEIEGPEDFLIKFLNSRELFKSEREVARPQKTRKKKQSGSRYDDILHVIRSGNSEGVSLNTIVEKTKLTKQQINQVLIKLKKNNEVKSISKGVYALVGRTEES
ncbi:hypothetical cytosolic protein [Syntrophus aciditrophicus SB]|uniref:Hypothetical cytosolic protein n=2 Tax=Syntrophus TaxID=43773 RepID=Q2LRI9_SYNAS|nr:hypothetical cytosolic protein [Syntrophus aciditrophicus SB]